MLLYIQGSFIMHPVFIFFDYTDSINIIIEKISNIIDVPKEYIKLDINGNIPITNIRSLMDLDTINATLTRSGKSWFNSKRDGWTRLENKRNIHY